jgi:hypothetical protein
MIAHVANARLSIAPMMDWIREIDTSALYMTLYAIFVR